MFFLCADSHNLYKLWRGYNHSGDKIAHSYIVTCYYLRTIRKCMYSQGFIENFDPDSVSVRMVGGLGGVYVVAKW